MILLEYGNCILFETIKQAIEKASADKKEPIDVTCADFDGVSFHILTDSTNKSLLNISIQWRAVQDLKKHGADAVLKREYGSLLLDKPEGAYDYTLQLNLDALPANKDNLPEKISLFKRHLLAAPFEKVFDSVEKGQKSDVIEIAYRDDESFYLKSEGDQAFIIFSISFRDADDAVFGKVFLQEFADARKVMSNVPAVNYTYKEAPLELKNQKSAQNQINNGFVTFVLFKNHIDAKHREKSINNIQTFRDYLHYHIKCSKAYMHNRMRNRVDNLLQVLNRAKIEDKQEKEKKTIAGKTFVRK